VITRLAGLLLLLGLVWLVSRLFRRPARGGAAARGGVREEGPMVRDRVCNTFLPRSRALVARIGDEERFFCSESCRRKALEQAAPAGPAEQTGA
jgi:hypothetical protein